MRVICAPDSFKESLSADDAAEAMARGVRRALPDAEVDVCPIADGGEGTVRALVTATGGRLVETQVVGPLGEPVRCQWGWLGEAGGETSPRTAVVELASASGLMLVPKDRRDPTKTTTCGTGQAIAAALEAGAQRIVLGIGGSATNDAGCGAAQALGVRFFDEQDQLLHQPITGGDLSRIARIDLSQRDSRLDAVELVVACDVTNPLHGRNGAAHVYARQKGADDAQIRALDAGLAHLAKVLARDTGHDVAELPGAGAAGGIGGGAVALLGAKLESGIERVLSAVDFHRRVAACDLCLTGEGKLDAQSLSGKAVAGVVAAARRASVPVVAIAGVIEGERGLFEDAGLADFRELGPGLSQVEAIRRAAELMEARAGEVASAWRGNR